MRQVNERFRLSLSSEPSQKSGEKTKQTYIVRHVGHVKQTLDTISKLFGTPRLQPRSLESNRMIPFLLNYQNMSQQTGYNKGKYNITSREKRYK